MNFTILKAGRIIGPLDPQEVAVLLAGGQISENDLAQRGDVPFWVPLRRLVPVNENILPPEPVWRGLSAEAARAWAIFNEYPLQTGLAALAYGCLMLALAPWPALLFAPPLLSAVFAAAVLLSRRKYLTGALLCVAALLLPALLLLFVDPLRMGPKAPAETLTPVAESPPELTPRQLRSPVPPATLLESRPRDRGESVRGVALPRPVSAPPAPALPALRESRNRP